MREFVCADGSRDAGHAALPGGKADALGESPFTVARREAYEEIGLPMDDRGLPEGYRVEHLTELPANLAMTELGVRPCVAYLESPEPSARNKDPDVARDILPRLDRCEVAAVFTAPFYNFLKQHDLHPGTRREFPGDWYQGSWRHWHESAWRMHQFFVPVSRETAFLADNPRGSSDPNRPPRTRESTSSSTTSEGTSDRSSSSLQPPLPRSAATGADDALAQPRYCVFGMTARIVVDSARVAYDEEPAYEHNSHFGDEDLIDRLLRVGRMGPVRKKGEVLTRDVMVQAKQAKF